MWAAQKNPQVHIPRIQCKEMQPAYKSIDYSQTNQSLSPPLDTGSDSKTNSPIPTHHQQPSSRPGSGLAGQQGHQGQYQDQNRAPQQQNKSSVVIKVGMVGDAQIGKTSLMVKYVEGSWDEDYIQTLGSYARRWFISIG